MHELRRFVSAGEGHRRRWSAFCGCLAFLGSQAAMAIDADVATAGSPVDSQERFAMPLAAFVSRPPIAAPARLGSPGSEGPLVGVDAGLAVLPARGTPGKEAGSFGFRAGYAIGGGLSADARYDYLGVIEYGTPLNAVTLGARYELPTPIEPFVEVRAGLDLDRSQRFGAAVGLGLALPISRHLAFDAVVRDWMSAPGSRLVSAVTMQLGATITFASRGR